MYLPHKMSGATRSNLIHLKEGTNLNYIFLRNFVSLNMNTLHEQHLVQDA